MGVKSLAEWLSWQETLHPEEIELGLGRVRRVADRLGLLHPQAQVVTVAGTNGKGSSIALLDAIARAAGKSVGLYTSPHLIRYNERIVINGECVTDAQLCGAFERVDRERKGEALTYFEFGT
ncbi:MAG TPA: bifunctional folylpolyglutamate synthase/dihydrofolate synthase, partial [Gammaproteobacteria bacterium]|nr:bifunctional folylpolyglutamate synthase/dihydrofolate synthase [Gammaproteobacteria bacterium]